MQDVTANLAKKTDNKTDEKAAPMLAEDRQVSGGWSKLDHCFGQIGISAVAAAVRYQGSAKNPAYAPCSNQWRDLIADIAA
jgi:hypothetical protein